MNEIVLLFLEKICEAIYFSAFLIIGKGIKEKRILFTAIMIFEYILLTSIWQFNIWIQITYTFLTYINLKVLYRDKAQVTDIFLFMIASIILIILGLICGSFQIFFNISHNLLLVINRILMFLIIYLIKDKIYLLYKKYCSYWNRHKYKNKIKSLTLRNISIIVFNLMFYIINIGLIYAVLISK